MNMDNVNNILTRIFSSKLFKKATFILGLVFLVTTVFITIDPRPFIKFGYLGVFVYNLFGAGTIIVALLANYMNVYLLAFVSAWGNTFNDSVSYVVGKSADDLISKHKHATWVQRNLGKYGMFYLFLFSLIPFPYDFIGGVVGYLHYPYKKFMIATFMGKVVRFLLLGFGISAFNS